MHKDNQTIPEYYGQGGRLESPAAPELVDSAYAFDCSDADVRLKGISYADIAHSMMLIKKGIVPENEGKTLISGLLKLHEIDPKDFPIRPELGDVYNSREAHLRELIGAAGGWQHAGKPRRETVNTGYLIQTREYLLKLIESHINLLDAFVFKAEECIDVIMPDYTYLHHAHPTSLGHYLLTYAFPIIRDLDRLKNAYKWINQSNTGSGSVNGSRLDIDREMLREDLGFDGISLHARDAMWQPDTPIELMANLNALLININRFSEELQIWSTHEFSMVELPDEYCRASVMMPQKKNPYPMCYLRGLTGSMMGKMTAITAAGKTYSGNPDSRTFVYSELAKSIVSVTGAVNLFQGIITKLAPNKKRMMDLVKQGYSNATDLADLIMTRFQIDYRTAHQISGLMVRKAVKDNISGYDIKANLIVECIREVTGKAVHFDQEIISAVTDPVKILETRKTLGGASKDQIYDMIAYCKKQGAEDLNWVRKKLENHLNTLSRLIERATAFSDPEHG